MSSSSAAETGAGAGFVVGYGFTPRWALYGNLSGARISSLGGNYGLGHFDIGTRVHFRSGAHVVVPFLQFGLSSRAKAKTVLDRTGEHDFTATGIGLGFGGGLNAHFTPKFAFSTGVTWSGGNFNRYTMDKVTVPGETVSATSARVHLGLIWSRKGTSPSIKSRSRLPRRERLTVCTIRFTFCCCRPRWMM